MLTDEEILQGLRLVYGARVGDGIEVRAERRFFRIDGLPVTYTNAYDLVAGAGAYESDHEAEFITVTCPSQTCRYSFELRIGADDDLSGACPKCGTLFAGTAHRSDPSS